MSLKTLLIESNKTQMNACCSPSLPISTSAGKYLFNYKSQLQMRLDYCCFFLIASRDEQHITKSGGIKDKWDFGGDASRVKCFFI